MSNTNYREEIFKLLTYDMKMSGDINHGKIEGLGNSSLARNVSDYIFSLPFNLEKFLLKSACGDVPKAGVPTLLETYKIFGFFTIGEILASEKWNERIADKIETKKDLFCACIEIANSFGYGVYEVDFYGERGTGEDITPDITVILTDSVEANYYTKWHGASRIPKCYLSKGLLISIANLVFSCDIKKGTQIDVELYEKVSTESKSHKCEEIECISQSIEFKHCVFKVTK